MSETKTIAQLKKLPKPYRTLAVKSFVHPTNRYRKLNSRATSVHDALNNGFSWMDSPQGHHFWQDIHNQLKNNGDDVSSVTWPKI